MIKIRNLKKSYGDNEVLKGINISVKKGEIYGFIGRNGAGKSTTMNILTGLIDFQEGTCLINSQDIKRTKKRIFKNIGYLPEDPKFYPYMSSIEYLEFIGRLGGDDRNTIKKKSEELLELVKLKKAGKRPIGGYSRGMRQRLGIAVSMYHNPDILLLDEPSSALDPEGRKDVIEIITCLKEQEKTILLSTHILNDIERVCDRVGILHDGKIVLENSIENLNNYYVKPVYDVEFEKEIERKEKEELLSKSFIQKIGGDNRKMSIYLSNTNNDRQKLIETISDMKLPMISFNQRKSSLEDIFMRVVEENE